MKTPKDWLAKYYPTPASEATGSDEEALLHSIRKWKGLELKTLDRYGIYQEGQDLRTLDSGLILEISNVTCALCLRYTNERGFIDCDRCPLKHTLGVSCDRPVGISPYHSFALYGNPTTMLRLLRKTLARIRKENGQ